ncbi:hypothetical protein K144313037_p10580 (plasmid) [Clostridium tetani]|uniref:hypothetical protein n=1 Tax=Clostridium tetani TaxID=1513 RepID=UPI000D214B6C|nr:hypothetical protein [Clostridium tetani]AVP55910.1 hypothetical protein C3B72_12490 [Clostridium tetani]RXI49616.1 hypothetical protein DP124_12900 [Clostridium tetani]RXI57154.1 hypothetical protein DP122_00515 [Clostridium tetani]RXI78827.1 hypothetical protein DP128_00190 [Clostridium tetani]WFN63292.1 hypothetical protein PAA20_13680 [Clostridium tetani]
MVDYKVKMFENKKIIMQWLGESILKWVIYLLMFYSFVEHDNFLTIIFLILIFIITLIFNILRKRCIIFNIFKKDNAREAMILPYIGMVLCTLFAAYARYKMIEKNVFYVIFVIFSLCYMFWQYKNFIES